MELSRRTVLSGLSVVAAAASTIPPVNSSIIKNLRADVEKAIQGGGLLQLPAGAIVASDISIDQALTIEGIAGRTRITSPDGKPVFIVSGADPIILRGLSLDGGDKGDDGSALVMGNGAASLVIEDCTFGGTSASGLRLEGCGGRVCSNHFSQIGRTAIFVRDSNGLEIAGNRLRDIGNNGIQVWTSEPHEDGTIVSRNRIERVRADAGGTGENGNGINVFRAGNVIVSENRITDCMFSAVRNNAGVNCHIVNNSISRMGEVAIYCEFGFQGAVVSGNIIEDVALGISITNFNEGGRLATVANNVIRRATGGGTLPQTSGVGIGAEGDATVIGNVVEDVRDTGISLGWGRYSRTLSASGNVVRGAPKGIVFSVSEGADGVLIANNRISGASIASILGADYGKPVTGDLGLASAKMPPGVEISGNLVS